MIVTYSAGDIVTVDFPGITGIKRRPAVVLSSEVYHSLRPDVIVGLITTQTRVQCVTDYLLQDWASSGLRVASIEPSRKFALSFSELNWEIFLKIISSLLKVI